MYSVSELFFFFIVSRVPYICICCVLHVHVCFVYRKTSNIRRILVSNIIVDNSDVVGASPVGAAPIASSLHVST